MPPLRRECQLTVDAIDGICLPGDLLLYRDSASLKQTLISRGGRSRYGHAGMLAQVSGRWIVLEMDQWRGGRWRWLDEAVREDRGRWDAYAADPEGRWPAFDRRRAVAEMWRFVGRRYGWCHIGALAARHLPVVRWLAPVVTDDDEDADHHAPICSEATAISYRIAGADVVRNLPDRLTEPGDLARSLFFDYTLTLVSEMVPCGV